MYVFVYGIVNVCKSKK